MQNFRFFLLRKNSLILLLTCCKKFGSHNSSKWYQNKRPRYRMIQVRSSMVDIHLTIELVRRILETSIPNNTASLWSFTLKITVQLWYFNVHITRDLYNTIRCLVFHGPMWDRLNAADQRPWDFNGWIEAIKKSTVENP